MNRMNVISICLGLLLFQPASFISAQVATVVNGYPVVDLSAWTPLGAVLTSAEATARRNEMNVQTPKNDALVSKDNKENGVWNTKMSIKYQVMRADRISGTTDWANAWALCKAYTGEGGTTVGSWRLPTQRELLMIRVLHPALIGKGGFVAFNCSHYWAATEFNTETESWAVDLCSGNTAGNTNPKISLYRVRCVRDVM